MLPIVMHNDYFIEYQYKGCPSPRQKYENIYVEYMIARNPIITQNTCKTTIN